MGINGTYSLEDTYYNRIKWQSTLKYFALDSNIGALSEQQMFCYYFH